MVNSDEPPFLAVGTEVSAKYKGAFCEAKIKKISKTVKCKVLYSNGVSAFVFDDMIKGELKIGATVEVKSADKKEFNPATIQKFQDCSQYTVVFDDGDITSLKRTALCLKSGRHFAASATLDQLPLTHPEHIGTPVRTSIVHGRRNRKHKKSVGKIGEEGSSMEEKDIGKVVCVESNDKKKVKDNWFPGLVVAPTAQSAVKTNITVDYLVRSFKDGKYYTVPKQEITEFTKEIGARVENPTLKNAVEKATLYLDKDELPPHWDRDLLFGLDKNCLTTDSEGAYDTDNSDEETIEEKDHFVAQLFKFMDDRGTPLNQIPIINGKDVDLYKLFKVVNNLGGFNKVSKCKHWKSVAIKMGHEPSAYTFKQVYQQYLHSFEDFYRKLGCTMLNHPRGIRSRNRFSRSIIRDIDKALPSSSTAEKNKNQRQEAKEKSETSKDNNALKDSVVNKKSAKNSKLEEKNSHKNKDDSKKSDKKKEDNSSRGKLSVKWDPDILETKDTKTKKDSKETLKKGEEKNDSTEQDDAEMIKNKIGPKKKNARNVFAKSIRKTPKKEKIPKVKPTKTGLPGARKVRAIKEQVKTFVKTFTPFTKNRRGANTTQQDDSTKKKPDEDEPKLTRSKSKEEVPNKLRKMSVLGDHADSIPATEQPKILSPIENQGRLKKTQNKKVIEEQNPFPHVNYKLEPLGKNALVLAGDILCIFYGDKHNLYSTTYDAKIINTCIVEEGYRYFVHYIGWNSRYDEWVDHSRICSKRTQDTSETGNEDDNDTISPKCELKKIPPTRIRRSITPSTSSLQRKKSPFSNGRPTRTCTLNDQLSTVIVNSDSESECIGNVVVKKQYNKKNQQSKTIKSQHDITIKTEIVAPDHQKKSLYPKTYPSKEVLMQRNTPKKSKSCVSKVHSNKSEGIELCEQVSLKTTLDPKAEMPPPTNNTKLDIKKEIVEIQIEDKAVGDIKIEPKDDSINYLSPKKEYGRNDLQIFESPSSIDDEDEMIIESPLLLTKSKVASVIFYRSSSEEEESVKSKKQCEEIVLPLNEKSSESKISGTDFDLNEIRSEMKGLMPTSANNNINLDHSEESMFQNQGEIEKKKYNEPVTEDIYEFKESEPCDFGNIPSVIEEKHRRVIKYNDPSKSYNFEKLIEPPIITESVIQAEETEHNKSVVPIEANSNNASQFDTIVKTNVKENNFKDKLKLKDEVENSAPQNQSDMDSDGSVNLVISDTIINSKHTNETYENSRLETCQINESDMKNEVLDLCMKPPESPPNNIFSMPGPNDTDNMVIEDEDDEDDDELKLVIADDKIDTDFQVDTDVVVGEEHNSSSEHTEEVREQSPLPMPQSVHQLPNTDSEDFRSSFGIKRNTILPRDTDDESTTSCNESIQNALMQSFQMYTSFNNLSPKTKVYQPYLDNNDESTKSGFEFESNSKSPIFENSENVQPIAQVSISESTNKKCNYETEKGKNKSEKDGSTFLPELQCREEIIDEEALNKALVIEYRRTSAEYDIHKPSTSKGHFDSIHQPCSSKDSIYETTKNISKDMKKNGFIDAKHANFIKSVIFDSPRSVRNVKIGDKTLTSGRCKDGTYDKNVPSTSKSSIYDNPIPSTSKANYNPESNVSDVLFCEETIPGSPTGTSEEQLDSEETKKTTIEQDLFAQREAASAMYAMNQSFRRPMITLMGATEAEMDEYTRILHTDGILDQSHLQFLAEISSRNLGINISEPSVTEPSVIKPPESEPKPEPEPEPIVKPRIPDKSQSKRKSSQEHSTSKRNKSSAITASTTQVNTEKLPEIKMPIPMKDGKPLVVLTAEMDFTQRQAVITARMNDLRKDYITVKAKLSTIDKKRKKIRKRRREMIKRANTLNKQLLAAK